MKAAVLKQWLLKVPPTTEIYFSVDGELKDLDWADDQRVCLDATTKKEAKPWDSNSKTYIVIKGALKPI